MTVWTGTENPTINVDVGEKGDTGEQPKVLESRGARQMRRRTVDPLSEKSKLSRTKTESSKTG